MVRDTLSVEQTENILESLPYIVIGHGINHEEDTFSGTDLISRSSTFIEDGELEPENIEVKEHPVPWSQDNISVEERRREVVIKLPRNTQIIGKVSSVQDCLAPGSSYKAIDFKGEAKTVKNVHKITGMIICELQNVVGIIFPKELPNMDDQRCRHLCQNIPVTYTYLKDLKCTNIHTGICLAESTTQISSTEGPSTGNLFGFLSKNYIALENDKIVEPIAVYEPFQFRNPPENIVERKGATETQMGIKVNVFKPLLVISVLAIVSPGVVQYLGSDDKKWGDLLNAVIGTGSVLLGVVNIIFYGLFGVKIWARGVKDGELVTTSNFLAKNFAKETVQKIEEMACDPNLPAGLIADYRNSAVRTERNGWLSIGNRIPFDEMKKHGYIVVKEKSVVLDLVQGKFYPISKQGSSAKILRNNEDYVKVPLDGKELFEI